MAIEQFIMVVFGLLSIWAFVIFGSGVLISKLIQKVGLDTLSSMIFVLVIIAVLTSFIALFVGYTCRVINPTEGFEDLESEVTSVEKDVCALIKRADNYITSDVGKAGQDDPNVLKQRLASEHGNVDGGIVVCNGDKKMDISDRIERMEQTLISYTQPVFTYTYGKSLSCEISAGVVPPTPVPGPLGPDQSDTNRLKNIRRLIAEQRHDYLNPMDKKESDARKGHVSDCDKQRGANTAVDTSNKMTIQT